MSVNLDQIREQLLPGLRAIERYSFGWHDWRSWAINAPDVIDGEWTRVPTPMSICSAIGPSRDPAA